MWGAVPPAQWTACMVKAKHVVWRYLFQFTGSVKPPLTYLFHRSIKILKDNNWSLFHRRTGNTVSLSCFHTEFVSHLWVTTMEKEFSNSNKGIHCTLQYNERSITNLSPICDCLIKISE